jgi:AraC-like DNA-binding protein
LLHSEVARVDDVHGAPAPDGRLAAGFSPDFQVCLPYRGFFIWHVGDAEVACDANQLLFVKGGEPFRLTQPIAGDYAELVITPAVELLADLAQSGGALGRHSLFDRRRRRLDFRLLHLRTRFLHHAHRGNWNELAAEEGVIALLRASFEPQAQGWEPAARTRRLVSRTKQFLEEHLAGPIRLTDVARAVGASPAYLTDVFRRVEGVPLHGYLRQLRLSRALVELPHASDLARLALDLGFSSHSHFTAAFRRAFGCTPSRFRESTSARNGSRRTELKSGR